MSVQLAFETVEQEDQAAKKTRQAMADRARRREQRIANEGLDRQRTGTQAEEAVVSADWRTSLADARTAVVIAIGVDLEDIDPATGKMHNARVYAAHRAGWQRRYDGRVWGKFRGDPDQLIPEAEEARQEFLAKRPDLDDGKPWINPRRYP